MNLNRSGAIVGAAEIPPRRSTPGITTLEMIARVSRLAVEDAGMIPTDIDGIICGPQVGETPQHVPATVAEYLGLQPRFADVVDLGGATGAGMVWRAVAAINAGMCETVLCVLGNTREPDRDSSVTKPKSDPRVRRSLRCQRRKSGLRDDRAATYGHVRDDPSTTCSRCGEGTRQCATEP